MGKFAPPRVVFQYVFQNTELILDFIQFSIIIYEMYIISKILFM